MEHTILSKEQIIEIELRELTALSPYEIDEVHYTVGDYTIADEDLQRDKIANYLRTNSFLKSALEEVSYKDTTVYAIFNELFTVLPYYKYYTELKEESTMRLFNAMLETPENNFVVVYNEGGGEGDGEYVQRVVISIKSGLFYSITGSYYSYHGTDWNENWTNVEPSERVITVF